MTLDTNNLNNIIRYLYDAGFSCHAEILQGFLEEYKRLERLNSNVQKAIASYEHNAKTYKGNGIILARYEAEAIARLLRGLYINE